MKFPFVLGAALLAFPVSARAAGYALNGTFIDSSNPASPRRVPAVLYVTIRGRDARLALSAPTARCVPEFGAPGYVGPARGEGNDTLAVHVALKGDCSHASDDARLYLRFRRDFPKNVATAELTDNVRGASDAPVLFETD